MQEGVKAPGIPEIQAEAAGNVGMCCGRATLICLEWQNILQVIMWKVAVEGGANTKHS